MSVGAPPDDFFTLGQDWGFMPLHPERERANEYKYLIACLRHHLQAAGVLRIDHVMQLHRLFWVPNGAAARDGVYVRYPTDDLYAILALESQRHRSMIIGENLGTVPAYINERLARRRIHTVFVSQFSTHPGRPEALPQVAEDTAASLNTHDTPTFAAFWQGRDLETRVAMGWMSAEEAAEQSRGRAWMRSMMSKYFGAKGELSAKEAFQGFLRHLAESDARVVLVSLEDLWQEERPQNLPGTGMEQPNWRRRARVPLEAFSQDADVTSTLKNVRTLRKGGRTKHGGKNRREDREGKGKEQER
jgi:4-alpha-glucanotransferase